MKTRKNTATLAAAIGGVIVTLILVLGTIWRGQAAKRDSDQAVRSASLLYLEELTGRREQVVEKNLQDKIDNIKTAIALMTEEDLGDLAHLQAYQARMRKLYGLEKFAFVDTKGTIYTAGGKQDNIADYDFDYRNITGPEISILNLKSPEKKVVIAIPTEPIPMEGEKLTVCFMEIDMKEMLQGVSMQSNESGATFTNIYTRDGIALSNTVLGGLAVEDNLLEAVSHGQFEEGYSFEKLKADFEAGNRGEASFTYKGIRETLAYTPVRGTDWLLTYLIRESVISEKIGSVSGGIITRSLLQSLVAVVFLSMIFAFILRQLRKNSRLELEKETAEVANRVKQEELEQRLTLQGKLLEEEKLRGERDSMITAMASDYRSVYHVDLDRDEAVCYRSDEADEDGFQAGDHFSYSEVFTRYANRSVGEAYREGFLKFIRPENLREGLRKEPILAYRYLARQGDREYYEMIRAADAGQHGNGEGERINTVGVGFTVIDAEMRTSMAQQQALSNALNAAEQASKAKTAFLSSMSHEIRTPMNVIIGLDNIALNDPETPEKTKVHLQKIGESAEHLLHLINDILDMSRIESGRLTLRKEEFSFTKLLEAMRTMFTAQCAEKGLEFAMETEGPVDEYYVGDGMKLRQVLINILGNAVKFTPEGGKVSLSVKRTARFDGLSTLQFVIADTGIGISREYLPHIFDTFSQEHSSNTSRYGSSGLGLAITKNIVEMMNGNIQVESEKGKGTVFTVTVTLMDAEAKHEKEGLPEIRPQDMSVLIVDDDPVACEHDRLVLEKTGIAAETASSGAEAVEMVKLRHARMEPYNLILVDWKMPEMDGVETTRQIRSVIGNESAIVILTAYKWDEVADEAEEAGVDSFLAKPLVASMVMDEFSAAVQRRGNTLKSVKTRPELKGRKVLLAEDVQVNAEIMKAVLQMREMEADPAENGRIAVEKFAEHPAGYYSAILMDMRMPEMDGLEATRRIRAMDREDAKTIPIIALTANAFDEDVQRSLQAGLNAHLSKPVKPDMLFETLEDLIHD